VYALATSPGPRIAGAFMRNVKVLLTSPSSGASNTSATVSLQGKVLDPLMRNVAISFQLDVAAGFFTPKLQTSSNVTGKGWADTPLSWVSAAIENGTWYYRGRSVLVAVGAGPNVTGRYAPAISFAQAGGAGITRSLYLYVNKGTASRVAGVGSNARSLYLYVNKGVRNHLDKPYARSLYLYVNKAMYPGVLVAGKSRALYLYSSKRDGEVFPYLNHLLPEEQYVGGQVDLYGDGFGQYLDATQSATITISSTSGGNVADFVRDGTASEWKSTSGASAWIRFTWGAAKKIVAIVLEGGLADPWGVPRFRFSDASSQDGGSAIAVASIYGRDAQYPIGGQRTAYWLATPKTSTYVEIAIASGGSGTNRGFSEVWVIEEAVPAEAAETARAVLNLGLLTEQTMGIVSWQGRSPNLYPANSGVPLLPAGTVTVPVGAVSGLVNVEETT
jgi:hypothetical protein